MCSVFTRLTVLSMLVITVGAGGCSSGGTTGNNGGTTSLGGKPGTTGGATSPSGGTGGGATTGTMGGATGSAGAAGTAVLQGVFTATGSMTVARSFHTATLLQNGKVLVAGGMGINIFTSAELYDPSTGTFTATGSMEVPREEHSATLLGNGKVLIAGGENGFSFLASAELYDPSTGTFAAAGSMTVARRNLTATLLQNGKVLIAGGCVAVKGDVNGDSVSTDSAELYDPSTGTFTATGSMTVARSFHTATLLQNGKVLIAGGGDDVGWLASAEIYDTVTEVFTATGSMSVAREEHTATLLSDGKVLTAGGGVLASAPSESAELYDPEAGRFTTTGNMTTGRQDYAATLLGNGMVLVAGGVGGDIGHSEVFPIRERHRAVGDARGVGGAGTHALLQTRTGSIGIAGHCFLTTAATHTIAACIGCQSRTL